MRKTKLLHGNGEPVAPQPLKPPSWNSTPTMYEATSAGSMARVITRWR